MTKKKQKNPSEEQRWEIIYSLECSHLKMATVSLSNIKNKDSLRFNLPVQLLGRQWERGEDEILVSKIDLVGDSVI